MKTASKIFASCFMAYNVHCQTHSNNQNLQQAISTVQYRANNPIEDRICYARLNSISGVMAAVFDGHGGDLVADFAAANISGFLDARLKSNLKNVDRQFLSLSAGQQRQIVQKALYQSFDDVENAFKTIFLNNISDINYQRVGACALATVITNKYLVVANSGDCQGVLLSENLNQRPLKINNRHNSGQPSEKQRLKREFPEQIDIVKCIQNTNYCYVKGRLQPTRSLGDFYLKDKQFNFTNLKTFTGPYITHKPQITSFYLQPHHNTLLLASDGLWDEFSDSQLDDVTKKFHRSHPSALLNNVMKQVTKKILLRNKIKSVEQLNKIDYRREMHDDISVIVVNLDTLKKMLDDI